MRFITEFVRRATRPRAIRPVTVERQPQARTRGKSPRARLREDTLAMLA